jgi:TIR domain
VDQLLPSQEKIKIFCSYSHKDEELRAEFFSSIALLRQQDLIEIWHDKQILPSDDWSGDISKHLETADIIALLVSRHFIDSDFCFRKELKRALERAANGQARVIPIIVSACDWEDAPFGHLQGMPFGGKAVTSWANLEEAWAEVAKSFKAVVRELVAKKVEFWKSEVAKTEAPSAPPAAQFSEYLAAGASAQQIYMQIMADRERMRREQNRIILALESLNSKLVPEPAASLKTVDQAFNNMDRYIRG